MDAQLWKVSGTSLSGGAILGFLLGLLASFVSGSAIADKNDCKAHESNREKYRACIVRLDKESHKRAKTVVVDKPITLYRNVGSKKDMEKELRSKSNKPLHATKHKYNSSEEAEKKLAMKKPGGYYPIRTQPGDNVKSAKNAGADGRQREYLTDREMAKRRAGAYTPYKK